MKAMVKSGCKHRAKAPAGGLGNLVKAGGIVDVTQEELEAFGDKLELYEENEQAKPPEASMAPCPDIDAYDNDVDDMDDDWKADATNSALELATDKNVDLRAVEGTGLEGRITLTDVKAYLDNLE